MEVVYKDESYAVMGACFEVYNQMGYGFSEPVYQECLEMELAERGLPFRAQAELFIKYKRRPLKKFYLPDFVCYEKIIVEIKAVTELVDEHRGQLHNYLKATGYKLGLLINFSHYPKLQYERIVR